MELASTLLATPLAGPQSENKRTLANRRNSLRSTGPRTAAGKHRVSFNARKTGLFTDRLWFEPGEYPDYLQIAHDLILYLRPVGPAELQLAQRFVDNHWQINRAIALEINALAGSPDQTEAYRQDCAGPNTIEKIGRAQSRLSRQNRKVFAELDLMQIRRLRTHPDAFDPEACPLLASLRSALGQREIPQNPPPECPESTQPKEKKATSEMALFCKKPLHAPEINASDNLFPCLAPTQCSVSSLPRTPPVPDHFMKTSSASSS